MGLVSCPSYAMLFGTLKLLSVRFSLVTPTLFTKLPNFTAYSTSLFVVQIPFGISCMLSLPACPNHFCDWSLSYASPFADTATMFSDRHLKYFFLRENLCAAVVRSLCLHSTSDFVYNSDNLLWLFSFLSLLALYLNFYYTTPIIGVLHNNNKKNKLV